MRGRLTVAVLLLAVARAAGQGGEVVLAPPDLAWFGARTPEGRKEAVRQFGGTGGSEDAVELGLRWLARRQRPDGHWSIYDRGKRGKKLHTSTYDVGLTGLATLAFQGAGYTHEGVKHAPTVRKGLRWLLTRQQANGSFSVRMYQHGITVFALADAYGLTRDRNLLERPLRQGLTYLVSAQSDKGGWRYTFRSGSDTSVTGWQILALSTGAKAGLKAPGNCLDNARRWFQSVTTPDGSVGYTRGHETKSSTAVGAICRMLLGERPDDAAILRSADRVLGKAPKAGSRPNYYLSYYGMLTLFQVGGRRWEAWNGTVRDALVKEQVRRGAEKGSWPPTSDYARQAGRAYATALAVLALEVYYRTGFVKGGGRRRRSTPITGAVAAEAADASINAGGEVAQALRKLRDKDRRAARRAANALCAQAATDEGRSSILKALPQFILGMESDDPYVASRMALAAGRLRSRHTVKALIDLLGSKHEVVRDCAVQSLRRVSGRDFGPALDADAAARRRSVARWERWYRSFSGGE